jgi:hypothetical protein
MITVHDQTKFLANIIDGGFVLQNKLLYYIEDNIGWNHAKQVQSYLTTELANEFNVTAKYISSVVDKIVFATDVKDYATEVDALEYIMFESNPWHLIIQLHETYNLDVPLFDFREAA